MKNIFYIGGVLFSLGACAPKPPQSERFFKENEKKALIDFSNDNDWKNRKARIANYMGVIKVTELKKENAWELDYIFDKKQLGKSIPTSYGFMKDELILFFDADQPKTGNLKHWYKDVIKDRLYILPEAAATPKVFSADDTNLFRLKEGTTQPEKDKFKLEELEGRWKHVVLDRANMKMRIQLD